jgi:autotransporter-associated beta strand protein
MKVGAGTLEITGQHTFNFLQINGGIISATDVADAGIASPLGIGSNISFSGGTLEYAGGTNDSTNRAVSLNAGGGHFRTAAGSGLLSLTGVISGSGGLTTDGFIELTALNTFTGPLTVVAGITVVPGVADSGVASPIGAGGAITLNNGALLLKGPLTSATNRPISISNGSSLGPGSGTVTFSGPITGSGLLGITGPGTLILSGNNTFEGDLYIVNTFLRVANGSAVPDSATVTVSDHPDAALQLNGSNETIGALTGGGALGGNITLGSGTLTIGANNTSTTYDGVISGTGGIVKVGSGNLILGARSSFSGTTTIQAGSLSVAEVADSGVNSPLGTNPFMTLGATSSIGTLIYTGASDGFLGRTITLNGNGGAITVNDASVKLTIAGQISGTGGLRITGPGTVVLANSTTYSGATIIGQGVLRQSGGSKFSENSAFTLTNAPGSVLDLNNINASLGSLAGGGPLGGTVLLGNPPLGAGADGTSTTFSGTITGAGGFVKTGAGTMKLNGTNTYTGVTNVSAGKLQFSGGNAIADTSPLLISANATAEFLDSTETVASLLGAGTVALSGGNMNIGTDNSGTLYDGVIAGTGNLTKVGSGNLRLSKSPTYTGSTSLLGGGLALEGGFETAGASITVATGANLQARGVVNRPIAGSGTITATGTLTIGDGNSISGFNFGGTLAVGTGQVTLSDANMADLGNLTTLDSGAQLGSTHGIRVAAGQSVLAATSASATIAGTLLNNGSIAGPTQSGQALSLTGDVTGAGGFQGMVRFTKSFNPGTWLCRGVARELRAGFHEHPYPGNRRTGRRNSVRSSELHRQRHARWDLGGHAHQRIHSRRGKQLSAHQWWHGGGSVRLLQPAKSESAFGLAVFADDQ